MSKKFLRNNNRLPISEIYKSNNSFFITICVQDRVCIFDILLDINFNESYINSNNGDTVVASTFLTKLCIKSLLNLNQIYENVVLRDLVIMPNHIHFIITFIDIPKSKITGKHSNLGSIIKSFKIYFQKRVVEATTVSPLLHQYFAEKPFNPHKTWQKSFHERVIRGEKEFQNYQNYIIENPLRWDFDELNPYKV